MFIANGEFVLRESDLGAVRNDGPFSPTSRADSDFA
jgi:hypothetical protein